MPLATPRLLWPRTTGLGPSAPRGAALATAAQGPSVAIGVRGTSGAGGGAEKVVQGLAPSLCSDLGLHITSAYLSGPEPGSVLGRLRSLGQAGATSVLEGENWAGSPGPRVGIAAVPLALGGTQFSGCP